jgi:hypothetical protein
MIGSSKALQPESRRPREYLPSQNQAMALLSRAVVPLKREEFKGRFLSAMEKEDDRILGEPKICSTPMR